MILRSPRRFKEVLLCAAMSIIVTGCVTKADEQQLKDDIFGVQSRVLQLENQLSSQSKELSSATNRQEASVSTRMDKVAIELQRIKGDIDALRVGVTTGQLPGADPEQEGSLAKTLRELGERLSVVEENQAKILSAIDKAGETKKPEKKDDAKNKDKAKGKEKKAAAVKSMDEMRAAFEKKKYKVIAEEGEGVLAATKNKKEKQAGTYILAESLYKTGDIRGAALKYADYIESKPKDNLSHAYLRMGDCFKQLGDVETAKIYYQELIQKFGSSDEAEQAKDKLAKL